MKIINLRSIRALIKTHRTEDVVIVQPVFNVWETTAGTVLEYHPKHGSA